MNSKEVKESVDTVEKVLMDNLPVGGILGRIELLHKTEKGVRSYGQLFSFGPGVISPEELSTDIETLVRSKMPSGPVDLGDLFANDMDEESGG